MRLECLGREGIQLKLNRVSYLGMYKYCLCHDSLFEYLFHIRVTRLISAAHRTMYIIVITTI